MDVPDNSLECFFFKCYPIPPSNNHTTCLLTLVLSKNVTVQHCILWCDTRYLIVFKKQISLLFGCESCSTVEFLLDMEKCFLGLSNSLPQPRWSLIVFYICDIKRDSSRIQPERKWIKKLQIYMLLGNCLCIEDTQDTCLKGM